MAQGKTNAVRLLDKAGVPYELHEYHVDMESAPRGGLGLEVARKAGIPPEAVFKTLVARGAGGHYVFVVPVAAQLDMSPNSLQRALYKAKRPDLAVQCHADAWGLR